MSKGLLLFLLSLAALGGWATVTVEDLPEHLVSGQPATLAFTVRQHGIRLLDNLQPSIEAVSSSGAKVQAAAPASGGSGRYTATFTLPSPGAWTITIESGFMNNRSTLEPIAVIAPGAPAPSPLAAAVRGRQLFVAKGCVTCHAYRGVSDHSVQIGPDLTDRRFSSAYLARFLVDPMGTLGDRRTTTAEMPNLRLSTAEIASLSAFLQGETTLGRSDAR